LTENLQRQLPLPNFVNEYPISETKKKNTTVRTDRQMWNNTWSLHALSYIRKVCTIR